jgi:hypothetical protein
MAMAKTAIPDERKRMFISAIAYLRFKGYRDIKAPFKDFKDPQAVFRKASEAGYIPDMIADKDFGTYLFEILDHEKMDNWESHLEKWRVFDEYAERKSGKFYFFAYTDEAERVNELLKRLDINPGVIQIKG